MSHNLTHALVAFAAARKAEARLIWEATQIAVARRGGYCLACLFVPGPEQVRFICHDHTGEPAPTRGVAAKGSPDLARV